MPAPILLTGGELHGGGNPILWEISFSDHIYTVCTCVYGMDDTYIYSYIYTSRHPGRTTDIPLVQYTVRSCPGQ